MIDGTYQYITKPTELARTKKAMKPIGSL